MIVQIVLIYIQNFRITIYWILLLGRSVFLPPCRVYGGGSKDLRWFVLSWFLFSLQSFSANIVPLNTTFSKCWSTKVQGRRKMVHIFGVAIANKPLKLLGGSIAFWKHRGGGLAPPPSFSFATPVAKLAKALLLCRLLFVVQAINFGYFLWITP